MGAQLSRARGADRLVAGAALALALFMFAFNWYGETHQGTLPGSDVGPGSSSTGWETFTNSRWVWLLTILVALASVIARTTRWRPPQWLKPGSVVALLASVSALLIGYRILHHPAASAGFGGFHASFGIRFGIWLGFAAALALAAGGYLQLRAETPKKPTPETAAPNEDATPAFSGLIVADEQRETDAP